MLASGWNPYPADRLAHLGYGKCANVVTNMDLEAMAKKGEFARPADRAAAEWLPGGFSSAQRILSKRTISGAQAALA